MERRAVLGRHLRVRLSDQLRRLTVDHSRLHRHGGLIEGGRRLLEAGTRIAAVSLKPGEPAGGERCQPAYPGQPGPIGHLCQPIGGPAPPVIQIWLGIC